MRTSAVFREAALEQGQEAQGSTACTPGGCRYHDNSVLDLEDFPERWHLQKMPSGMQYDQGTHQCCSALRLLLTPAVWQMQHTRRRQGGDLMWRWPSQCSKVTTVHSLSCCWSHLISSQRLLHAAPFLAILRQQLLLLAHPQLQPLHMLLAPHSLILQAAWHNSLPAT